MSLRDYFPVVFLSFPMIFLLETRIFRLIINHCIKTPTFVSRFLSYSVTPSGSAITLHTNELAKK